MRPRLFGPGSDQRTHNYVLPTRSKRLWGCSKTTRSRPRARAMSRLARPLAIRSRARRHGLGRRGDFLERRELRLQSQRRNIRWFLRFHGAVANMFSQIMGRTMEVGGTNPKFLNNVGVANNVPRGPQNPPGPSQYPGFPNSYTLLDLYHYSAPGTRDFSQTPGYFSIDGRNTNLNNFDATGDHPGNWAATVPNDAFGVSLAGQAEPVTPVDLRELGVLGWRSLSNVSTAAELSADIKTSISRRRRRAATERITSLAWRPARR